MLLLFRRRKLDFIRRLAKYSSWRLVGTYLSSTKRGVGFDAERTIDELAYRGKASTYTE